MKTLLLRGLGLVALAVAGAADAADLSAGPPPLPALPLWTWTGGYVGAHIGTLWGDTKFADSLGPSLFGDSVATPGFLGGFQTGYNWRAPQTRLCCASKPT